MKKLTLVLGLLVLLGTIGTASAVEVVVAVDGPPVAATVAFPGYRVIYGRPGVYCWYGGHYYSRAAWGRYCRRHPYHYHHDRHDHHDH